MTNPSGEHKSVSSKPYALNPSLLLDFNLVPVLPRRMVS